MSNENTTTEQLEQERAAFEAWCDSRGFDRSYWLGNNPQCGYANTRVMDYWEGWRGKAAATAAQPSQQWIPVAKQMPAEGEAVLVATEFDGPGDWRIKVGGRTLTERTGWHVFGASWTPSHWMPLPAAPAAGATGAPTA